jgi:predicted component of type VI protein secretion system
MFKLEIYLDGSLASTEFFTPKGSRYTIGRGTNCDRVISDPKISRAHCTLLKSGQDWVLYSGDVDNPVEESQGFLVGLDKRQTTTLTPGISVTLANFSNIKVILSRTALNSEKELPRLESDQSTNNEFGEDTLLEDSVDNDERSQTFLIPLPTIDRATTTQTLSPGFLLSALDAQTVNLENAIKPEFKIIDDRICTLEEQILVKSEKRKKQYLDLSKIVTYLGVVLLAISITAAFKGDTGNIQEFLSVISGIISIGMILKGQDSK